MMVVTLGIGICEEVSRDSGFGHEESDNMHDMHGIFHIVLHKLYEI